MKYEERQGKIYYIRNKVKIIHMITIDMKKDRERFVALENI